MDTSLALSMTNLGKSLNLIVCHAFTLSNLAMTDIFTHQKHFFAQILGTKFTNFTRFFWIATLALLARNDGKTKIQIFYSKFKAFYKFKSFHKFKAFCKFKSFDKFKAFYQSNSFHKFISNFKPYARFFHIFTPNFRSVQTDKFQHKEKKWQMKTPSLIILSI